MEFWVREERGLFCHPIHSIFIYVMCPVIVLSSTYVIFLRVFEFVIWIAAPGCVRFRSSCFLLPFNVKCLFPFTVSASPPRVSFKLRLFWVGCEMSNKIIKIIQDERISKPFRPSPISPSSSFFCPPIGTVLQPSSAPPSSFSRLSSGTIQCFSCSTFPFGILSSLLLE